MKVKCSKCNYECGGTYCSRSLVKNEFTGVEENYQYRDSNNTGECPYFVDKFEEVENDEDKKTN